MNTCMSVVEPTITWYSNGFEKTQFVFKFKREHYFFGPQKCTNNKIYYVAFSSRTDRSKKLMII